MTQRRKVLTVNNIINTALYNEARMVFLNGIKGGQDLGKIEAKYFEENPNERITIMMARRDAEWAVSLGA